MSNVSVVLMLQSPDNVRSILCVDRTFNVSSLFLTLTIFKNRPGARSVANAPSGGYQAIHSVLFA